MKYAFIFVQIIIVGVIVALQFLKYAFMPAIFPTTFDKRSVALEVISQVNTTLLIEGVVGLLILAWINAKFLEVFSFERKQRVRVLVFLVIVSFTVVFGFMTWFSFKYYSSVVDLDNR